MELPSTASGRAAGALLLALVAWNVYRAATQSITGGEAFGFEHFVRPPLRDTFAVYDADHQLLFTLLVKRTVGLFRLSTFSFRLPGILAGVVYLWAAYRLSRRSFGGGWLGVAVTGALAMHPLIRDHLSLGRSYMPGLALLLCGIDRLHEYVESREASRLRKLNQAGLFLGLSTAAHVIYAIPTAALMAATAAVLMGRRMFEWRAFVERLVVTALVSAFVMLAIPLSHATRESFPSGAATLRETAVSLGGPYGMHYGAALLLLIVFGITQAMRGRGKGSVHSLFLLSSVTLVVTMGGLAAAHAAGLAYPLSRTGLYLIPLFTLSVASMVAAVDRRVTWFAAGVLLGVYAAGGPGNAYREWPEDAGLKRLVEILRRDSASRAVRIGASGSLEDALNFYRARYRISSWEPVRHLPPGGDFDYYALDREDSDVVGERQLQVLYRDEFLVLARKSLF